MSKLFTSKCNLNIIKTIKVIENIIKNSETNEKTKHIHNQICAFYLSMNKVAGCSSKIKTKNGLYIFLRLLLLRIRQ